MEKNIKVRLQVAAGLVAGLFLLSSPIFAKSGYDANQEAANLKDMERIFGPVKGLAEKKDKDSSKFDKKKMEEELKKLEAIYITEQEERAAGNEAEKERIKNDRWRKGLAILAGTQKLRDDERAEQSQELKNLFATAKSKVKELNPQDLNMSGLEQGCSDGVDLSEFKGAHEFVTSKPFNDLKKESEKVIKEKDKKAKQEQDKNLKKYVAQLQKLADKDQEPEDDEDKDKKGVMNDDYALKARVDRQRERAKEARQERKTLRQQFVQALMELLENKDKGEDNDERYAQIGGFFGDAMEKGIKDGVKGITKAGEKLLKNCKKMVAAVGRGNAKQAPKETLIRNAYDWVVAYHRNKPQWADANLVPYFQTLTGGLKCPQPSGGQNLGAKVKSIVNGVRAAQDAQSLLTGAIAAIEAVGNGFAKEAESLVPQKNSCKKVEEASEMIRQYVGNIKDKNEKEKEKREKQEAEADSMLAQAQGQPMPMPHKRPQAGSSQSAGSHGPGSR